MLNEEIKKNEIILLMHGKKSRGKQTFTLNISRNMFIQRENINI